MFQVIHKDHNNLMDAEFFNNMKTVYDIKKDFETNQLMFLFYDYDKQRWYYEPAADYIPLGQQRGVTL